MDADDERMMVKVKKNVLCMLNDRNIEGEDSEITLQDERFMWGMKRDSVMVVVYRAVKQAVFTELEEQREKGITHCIVICWTRYTPAASKSMQQVKGFYEQFSHSEFVAPAIHNHMVAPHRLLGEKEKATILDDLHIKNPKNSLPRILTTEPVQRWYNAPLGSVYEIIRCNGMSHPQKVYRIVCEPYS